MRRFLIILGTLAAAVPTLVLAQGRECTEERPDSLTQATPPIHRECDVARPAERQGGHPSLNYRPADVFEVMQAGCLTAEVSFVVNTAGRVEPATVTLVETSYPEFGHVVLATIERLRYRPAQLDGQPVRQLVTYSRSGKAPTRFAVRRVGSMTDLQMSRPVPRVTLESC